MNQCKHIDEIRDVYSDTHVCEECINSGDSWVHLRVCKICGTVGCCDSSKNQHARKHYHGTGHRIIQSYEPGEDWYWCYEDEAYFRIK